MAADGPPPEGVAHPVGLLEVGRIFVYSGIGEDVTDDIQAAAWTAEKNDPTLPSIARPRFIQYKNNRNGFVLKCASKGLPCSEKCTFKLHATYVKDTGQNQLKITQYDGGHEATCPGRKMNVKVSFFTPQSSFHNPTKLTFEILNVDIDHQGYEYRSAFLRHHPDWYQLRQEWAG